MGKLAVIGAAIASVYGWILLKQLINDDGYSPVSANGLSMLIGGSLALGHSLLTENWNPTPIHGPILPFLECTIFLIIVSNCIAYNLYGHLLKRFSATFMSFAGLTTPLFSALFGWGFPLGGAYNEFLYIVLYRLFWPVPLFIKKSLVAARFLLTYRSAPT